MCKYPFFSKKKGYFFLLYLRNILCTKNVYCHTCYALLCACITCLKYLLCPVSALHILFSFYISCKNDMVLTIPRWSSRQGDFHPKPLTEPYVILSHHTALVIISLADSPLSNGRTFLDSISQYNAKDVELLPLPSSPSSLFFLTTLQVSNSQN